MSFEHQQSFFPSFKISKSPHQIHVPFALKMFALNTGSLFGLSDLY